MLNYINKIITIKIKLFNLFSFIIFTFLIMIFDLNVNLKIYPANLIFFMSFTNVLLMFSKSENIKNLDYDVTVIDFKALVLCVILISLLSVFLYLMMMFISNSRLLNFISLIITFTLLINVMYASIKLLKVSNLLMLGKIKE